MLILELIFSFIKVGTLSFGGGAPMIGFFASEIASHSWSSILQGYHVMVAIAQLLPGPFGIDASVYIGYRVLGFPGAFITSLSITLPTFLIVLLIAHYYEAFQNNRWIQIFLKGLRPLVIALLVLAIDHIFPSVKTDGVFNDLLLIKAFTLFVVGYVVLTKTKMNAFFYFSLFGCLGLLLY